MDIDKSYFEFGIFKMNFRFCFWKILQRQLFWTFRSCLLLLLVLFQLSTRCSCHEYEKRCLIVSIVLLCLSKTQKQNSQNPLKLTNLNRMTKQTYKKHTILCSIANICRYPNSVQLQVKFSRIILIIIIFIIVVIANQQMQSVVNESLVELIERMEQFVAHRSLLTFVEQKRELLHKRMRMNSIWTTFIYFYIQLSFS